MPYLFLYGPPGSGKTTWIWDLGLDIVDGDVVLGSTFNGQLMAADIVLFDNTDFKKQKNLDALEILRRTFLTISRKGKYPVTILNNLIFIQEALYIEEAPEIENILKVPYDYRSQQKQNETQVA